MKLTTKLLLNVTEIISDESMTYTKHVGYKQLITSIENYKLTANNSVKQCVIGDKLQ